jgi:carboxypeptidase family protein
MRRVVVSLILIALSAPSLALAQEAASIVGLVRDTSGAVMPGVTVEAASDALIEKTRTAVSDSAGRFAIVSLRPGTYSVTFSLTGFKTIKREGIVLSGAFAATVNADLEVGALEETVTVSGASPVVDLQSTQNQFVANQEMLDALPATRTMQGGASLVPGVSFFSQGFVSTMSVHGSASADQRVYQDGMRIGQNLTGTGSQGNGTGVNDLGQEELVYDAGSQSAETAIGGVRMDSIPKEGGNRFLGSWRTFYSGGGLQQDNIPDQLRQYIREGDELDYNFNTNATFGGPIRKDRLWFFMAFRYITTDSLVSGVYNADGSRVSRGNKPAPHGTFRLTGQLNQNNKLRAAYYNSNSNTQRYDAGCTVTSGNVVACTAPEAAYQLPVPMSQSWDAKWTSTVTNRLLVEVQQSLAVATYRFDYQPENGPFAIQNRNSSTGWRTVASATAYADYLSNVWHLNGQHQGGRQPRMGRLAQSLEQPGQYVRAHVCE